jgi:LysR family glycine cleavage system transcriptional activator
LLLATVQLFHWSVQQQAREAQLRGAKNATGYNNSVVNGRAGDAGGGRARARRHARDGADHETIYLVSRTEQARDRRIGALRKWIMEAAARAK